MPDTNLSSGTVMHTVPSNQVGATVLHALEAFIIPRVEKGVTTVVATCAGRTIKTVLEAFRDASAAGTIPKTFWQRVKFVETDGFTATDERPNTNKAELEEAFFAKAIGSGLMPAANYLGFECSKDADQETFDEATRTYGERVMALTGKIDVVLLGAGGGTYWPNRTGTGYVGNIDPGHVAGIMPGYPWLWKETTVGPYEVLKDSPKPPARRMTLTPYMIRRAGLVVGMITTTGKAATLANFLNKDIDPVDCPVKVVHEVYANGGSAHLITDIVISSCEPPRDSGSQS